MRFLLSCAFCSNTKTFLMWWWNQFEKWTKFGLFSHLINRYGWSYIISIWFKTVLHLWSLKVNVVRKLFIYYARFASLIPSPSSFFGSKSKKLQFLAKILSNRQFWSDLYNFCVKIFIFSKELEWHIQIFQFLMFLRWNWGKSCWQLHSSARLFFQF